MSGVIALARQAFPGLGYADLEATLKQTAQDLDSDSPDGTYGYGLIDVLAAYRQLVPFTDADGDGFVIEEFAERNRIGMTRVPAFVCIIYY